MRARAASLLLVSASLLAAAALPARANTEASERVTLFSEPSKDGKGVTVYHPQTDVSAALGESFNIHAGYAVDVVTGASRKQFGLRSGVDAVASATQFSDTRQEVKGGFSFERPTSSIAFSYSYGWESDYRSHSISGLTRSDLYDHNFTLAVGYTHNFDSVCDQNNVAVADQPLQFRALDSSSHCFGTMQTDVVTHRLAIDTFEPSLTWTMTPRLVTQLGGTIQILDGFQSNPYREVKFTQSSPQEHEPEFRQRYALFGRAAYALPAIRGSSQLMVRLYRDSWAVQSISGEAQLNKYVGNVLLFNVRARYHVQQEASFYRSALDNRNLGPKGAYWTGDRELSPMSNALVGAKVSLLRRPQQEKSSWFTEMEFAAKGEVLVYFVDPNAPNSDRPFAEIFQIAFTLRF
jgi:hypothetical protein